ncbi:hypothetical protein F5Y15DRAFT_73081 [Xylariaceae sp. FL0016]|nr:hypothetical protein F5Y15DRAFT_73081 [Xylariaceae sp. FL0016]
MKRHAGGQIISLTTQPNDQALNGRYRRNGKLQSCEPCRKSKLRCDHTVPKCSRCVKRKCVDKCVYHPNPLTKARHTQREAPLTPCTTTNDEGSSVIFPSTETPQPASPSSPVTDLFTQRTSEGVSQVQRHRAASAPPPPTHQDNGVQFQTGFLGTTHFTSIFTESLGKYGVTSADLDTPHLQQVPLSNDRIVRGCEALAFLKNKSMVNRFVARYIEICEGGSMICPGPLVRQWLLNLSLHHGETLKSQEPDKIRRLCELLWRNTRVPLIFNESTSPSQWAQLATGANIRWEVIGLIAAIVGQCAQTLSPSDQFLKEHGVARPALPRQMNDVAATCLSFCRDCDTLDDLTLWLLMENSSLTSVLKGDGSYALYRESGELVNAVMAMGLHVDVKAGKPGIPFFLEQRRKRLLIHTYSCDISISSFLGRPPRLQHRYCNFTPPLDIPDSVLLSRKEDIAQAEAELDENGFNKVGRVTRATWTKCWLGFAPMREDVLDLALGQYSCEETLRRAEVISQRSEEYWVSLPPFVQKIRDEEIGTTRRTPMETLLKAVIKQGFRVNALLLERILIRKTGASSDKLVHIARLILSDMLSICRCHEVCSVFQNDVASLLASQGLRSAAVIAVELLRQEQLPSYPRNPLLPRSQTIQDLTVFAARLGDLDPSEGAYGVCDQGRKVITRILDKILSTPTVAHQQTPAQGPGPAQDDLQAFGDDASGSNGTWQLAEAAAASAGMVGELSMGSELNLEPFLGHDNDFMQWLESVDWDRPLFS